MKVAIVGATGYSGIELIRLLLQHPYVTIHRVISGSQSGVELTEIYPHLDTILNTNLDALDVDQLANEVDLVFYATPSGISKDTMPYLMDKGIKCIDLSGDFRLNTPDLYKMWYKKESAEKKYLDQAVYGLSEIFTDEIKNAQYIANPGCYPTATALGLIPALKHQLIDPKSIIIDGKSGVSGAGRSATIGSLYSEVNENLKAYKLGSHQHIPEIEQTLSRVAGRDITVTFSTHLIPMTRGIMCTIYTNLIENKSTTEIIELYKDFYKNNPFVRIRKEGIWPSTKEVYGTNYCDLGFVSDPRTGRLTIVSVIDNLVKGAAGQAVQNLNIMNGWDESTGLKFTPVCP